MAGTYETPSGGQPNKTEQKKQRLFQEGINNLLNSENKLAKTSLATGVGQIVWYTPKVIATEESRTNTAFGTLTTADEIKEIVLPANGLIYVTYSAIVKCSVSAAGRAAVFLSAGQARNRAGGPQEASLEGTEVQQHLATGNEGLQVTAGIEEGGITGGTGVFLGSLQPLWASAGTYNISVQFRATSGKVTAKTRKLWVATLG